MTTPRLLALLALILLPSFARAQLVKQPDGTLYGVYPAGGQRGTTVAVEFAAPMGLDTAKGVVIDGAPGITVKDFKSVAVNKAQATFVIAPDAAPGPRSVRVVGGAAGLTSCRTFFVSTIPEVIEKEPNETPAAAQLVALPAVVNGRFEANLDIDCFAFDAKAGQRVIAAVLAHGMDSRMRTRGNNGFLDATLELLDAKGKVVASAGDTLGLDPLIEYTVPVDGRYTARVLALGFEGSPGATYRLTLGDVPIPTTAFPAGVRRGGARELEISGFNVPRNALRTLDAPQTGLTWQTVSPELKVYDGRHLPLIFTDHPEVIEAEPNDEREKANPLRTFRYPDAGVAVNGRFNNRGDQDWFRFKLKKGEGVLLEIAAQRHLRSPVDTLVEVFDATGKKLAENDDGLVFMGQCEHDFPSADSRLEFTAPADGEYFVRVTDQNGLSGKRAVYVLTVAPLVPGFRLHQWPDAVPVWGPGATASFVVQVQRWGGLKGDIALRIEGLPAGWKGSAGIAQQATYYDPRHGLNQKVLMTLTAPPDAKVGDLAAFRVVGKVVHDGTTIEREAWPQTLLGSAHTDRMHLRYSQVARAAVAVPLDCRIEVGVKELTVEFGGKVTIPVKVHRAGKNPIAISVDGETPAAGSAWRAPLTLKDNENEITLELDVGRERRPGTYGIVVSRSWAADLRAGRPGPCSELILIHIKPAKP
jgi:hypothetical protein